MTMPIITDMKLFGYSPDGEPIYEPIRPCLCPNCMKGILEIRAHVRRHYRKAGTGEKVWVRIPLGECNNKDCGRTCRILPDCMAPFKHFKVSIISAVLDGKLTEESPADFPSTQTMRRWAVWLTTNKERIEGLLRSIGYATLSYGEGFLFYTGSYLEDKRRATRKWLNQVIRSVYNAGHHLLSVYPGKNM